MKKSIPKKCENEKCEKYFSDRQKIILHNDLFSNWFFCSDKCYDEWLVDYEVKKYITFSKE